MTVGTRVEDFYTIVLNLIEAGEVAKAARLIIGLKNIPAKWRTLIRLLDPLSRALASALAFALAFEDVYILAPDDVHTLTLPRANANASVLDLVLTNARTLDVASKLARMIGSDLSGEFGSNLLFAQNANNTILRVLRNDPTLARAAKQPHT